MLAMMAVTSAGGSDVQYVSDVKDSISGSNGNDVMMSVMSIVQCVGHITGGAGVAGPVCPPGP